MPRRKPKQGTLEFRTWGGRRRGAGRPRTRARAGVPHRARTRMKGSEPQHVTIRLVREIARRRTQKLYLQTGGHGARVALELCRVPANMVAAGRMEEARTPRVERDVGRGVRSPVGG